MDLRHIFLPSLLPWSPSKTHLNSVPPHVAGPGKHVGEPSSLLPEEWPLNAGALCNEFWGLFVCARALVVGLYLRCTPGSQRRILSGVLPYFAPVYFLKTGSLTERGARLVTINPRNPHFSAP